MKKQNDAVLLAQLKKGFFKRLRGKDTYFGQRMTVYEGNRI